MVMFYCSPGLQQTVFTNFPFPLEFQYLGLYMRQLQDSSNTFLCDYEDNWNYVKGLRIVKRQMVNTGQMSAIVATTTPFQFPTHFNTLASESFFLLPLWISLPWFSCPP